MSWIALEDEVGAIVHLLGDDSLSGPFNLTSPNPVTNAEFTRVLGRVLARPTVATVPAIAIRLAFGEMGENTILASQRVMPQRLLAATVLGKPVSISVPG